MDTFPEGCGYRVAIVRMNQLDVHCVRKLLTQREAEHLRSAVGLA